MSARPLQHQVIEAVKLADGGKTVFDGYPLSRAEYVERIHEGGRGGYGIATHDVLMHHDAALRARVAELERVIDAAPHGQGCEGWREFPVSACNCWKASVR